MATATVSQVFDALALNIDDADIGEATQRSFIVRVLAALGHSHAPEILTSMLDGSRVRLYHWKDSPAGDFILVSGPQFKGKLVRPRDLVERDDGFYLRAVPDTSKAAESVLKAAASGRAEASRAARAMERAEAAGKRAGQRATDREARAVAQLSPSDAALERAVEAERLKTPDFDAKVKAYNEAHAGVKTPFEMEMESAIPVRPTFFDVPPAPAAAPRAPRKPQKPRVPRDGPFPGAVVYDEASKLAIAQSDEDAAAALAEKMERMFA